MSKKGILLIGTNNCVIRKGGERIKTVLLGIAIILFGIALIIVSIGTEAGTGFGLGTALFGLIISVIGNFMPDSK